MSGIKPMGVLAGLGGAIGAGLGFLVGGPAAVPLAMKTGIAGGVQVAVLSKADDALDAAGNKIGMAADKSADAIEKMAEKIGCTIEKVADVWSKLFLIGYGTSIAFSGMNQSSDIFNKMCQDGLFSNPLCIGSFTTASAYQTFTVAAGCALMFEIYKLAKGKK